MKPKLIYPDRIRCLETGEHEWDLGTFSRDIGIPTEGNLWCKKCEVKVRFKVETEELVPVEVGTGSEFK